MLLYFKKLTLLHYHLISNYYEQTLLKSKGQKFINLFNFKSALKGTDVRFKYNQKSTKYEVISNSDHRSLAFYHEGVGNLAYNFGIFERGETLGKIYFLDQINFKDGDTVLDCGANVGDLLIWFQNRNLLIDYIGFEPSPKEFECLKQNAKPHLVYNIGLWCEHKILTFYVSSQNADSSIIEPKDYDEEILVLAVPLSDYMPEKVKLLKLEAEGAEPEVLKGLGESIERIEFIAADVGYERGKECESTLEPVTNFLLNKNFSLIKVSHDRICALYKNNNFNQE